MSTQAQQVPLDLAPSHNPSMHNLLLAEARMIDESHAELHALVERVAKEFGQNKCASLVRYDPMGRAEALYHVPERLFAAMVDRVAVALSPTETPLVLPVDDLRSRYFSHRPLATRVPFTCVDLVERLLAAFAPRALELAYQQAALSFARVFGLRHQKKPKTVAGRLVLEHGASVDQFWTPGRYSSQSQESIRNHLNALAVCLPFACPNLDARALRVEVAGVLCDLESNGWVPDRAFRGEVAGVQIRLFQSAVKYHFPLAHVQALNLFCVQHAPDYFAQN